MLHVDCAGPVIRVTLARRVLGMPMRQVCVYLVDGLLIDSGPPATSAELVDWLKVAKVEQVYNTHHHEDHAGGNARIQRELGVQVAAGSRAAQVLADLPGIELYRRLAWGRPESSAVQINNSVVITPHHTFEVIPTPGHSPDHVCLMERGEGWLFGGDLFVHERVRYLRADEDLHLEIAALAVARQLAPKVLYCAHAGVVTDPAAAIERKLRFWAEIRKKGLGLQESGLPLSQIRRQLLGREDLLTRFSGGHFSKSELVRALLDLPSSDLADWGG